MEASTAEAGSAGINSSSVGVSTAGTFHTLRNAFVRQCMLTRTECAKNRKRLAEFTQRCDEQKKVVLKYMHDNRLACVPVEVPRLDNHSRPTGETDTFYVRYSEKKVNPSFTAKALATVLQADGNEEADTNRVRQLLQASYAVLREHAKKMDAHAAKKNNAEAAGEQEQQSRGAAARSNKRRRSDESQQRQIEKEARAKQRRDEMNRRKEIAMRDEMRIQSLAQSIERSSVRVQPAEHSSQSHSALQSPPAAALAASAPHAIAQRNRRTADKQQATLTQISKSSLPASANSATVTLGSSDAKGQKTKFIRVGSNPNPAAAAIPATAASDSTNAAAATNASSASSSSHRRMTLSERVRNSSRA